MVTFHVCIYVNHVIFFIKLLSILSRYIILHTVCILRNLLEGYLAIKKFPGGRHVGGIAAIVALYPTLGSKAQLLSVRILW